MGPRNNEKQTRTVLCRACLRSQNTTKTTAPRTLQTQSGPTWSTHHNGPTTMVHHNGSSHGRPLQPRGPGAPGGGGGGGGLQHGGERVRVDLAAQHDVRLPCVFLCKRERERAPTPRRSLSLPMATVMVTVVTVERCVGQLRRGARGCACAGGGGGYATGGAPKEWDMPAIDGMKSIAVGRWSAKICIARTAVQLSVTC